MNEGTNFSLMRCDEGWQIKIRYLSCSLHETSTRSTLKTNSESASIAIRLGSTLHIQCKNYGVLSAFLCITNLKF